MQAKTVRGRDRSAWRAVTSSSLLMLTTAMLMTGFVVPTASADVDGTADATIDYAQTLLIQLRVTDLDRAIEFYRDVLDLELDTRNEELRWAKLWLPGRAAQIGIGEGPEAKGSGTTSINIGVRDIVPARALLERRGVEFAGPTIDIPGIVQLADFQDPDGNRLRLAGPSPRVGTR